MPAPRRKRRVGLLAGDSLKNLGMVSGLIVTLWQGWQAGRKAEHADSRVGQVQAQAVTASVRRSGRVDSLARELATVKAQVKQLQREQVRAHGRIVTPLEYGPEPMPAGYVKPRGFWSRMLGHNDR